MRFLCAAHRTIDPGKIRLQDAAIPDCTSCRPQRWRDASDGRHAVATFGALRRRRHASWFAPDPVNKDHALADGAQLGRFHIVRFIDRGGMGEVYEAEDTSSNRRVAIKVVRPKQEMTENDWKRFEREGKLGAIIQSDHVAAFYEVDKQNGILFLVMELLDGCTLENWLKGRQVTETDIRLVARHVLTGLAAAHKQDAIHRDIKPTNLFVEKTGRVKILDFGLVREVNAVDQLTSSGVIVGTLGYLSPEQARCGQVDCRSDLFSLGVVLYRMVTGKSPFHHEKDKIATLNALANVNPPKLAEVQKGFSPALSDFIHCSPDVQRSGRSASGRQ
jgi:serine/threonine protein kinase